MSAASKKQPSTKTTIPPASGAWSQKAALRFVIVFISLVVLFYIPYTVVSQTEAYASTYLSAIAHAADFVLRGIGQDTSVSGPHIQSAALSFRIIPGCDGTEGFALFGAAVLASPFAWRPRLVFLAIGVVVLFVVNTLRIVTLFLIGVYLPDTFHASHMDLWPGFLILAVLICWLTWARWMVGRQAGESDEAN